MKTIQALSVAALLATGVVSQQSTCTQTDGSCDTAQNSATSSNPRIIVNTSTMTDVYTPVATSTNVIVSTTSLPHSLNTVTTGVVVSSTSQSVYTTNTLHNGASSSSSAAATTAANAAPGSLGTPAGLIGAMLAMVAAVV